MDAQPARSIVIGPMGIGEVVDRGFTLARRNFRHLAGIASWGFAIGYFLQGLLSLPLVTIEPADLASGGAMLFMFLGALAGGLAYALAGIALALACARIIDPRGEAGPLTTVGAYGGALTRILPTIGLAIIVVAASIPLVIVLPLGIWIWGRWSVAGNAVILEQLGPVAALKRSWALTRKSWWHTVIVLFLAGLAVAIVQGAVGAVLGLASQAAVVALGSALIGAVLNAIAGAAVAIVVAPFSIAVGVVLYYELRARAEGLDLERRLIQATPAE
jgi:hypothetical protein